MLASNYGYFDTELCKRQIKDIDKSSLHPVKPICMDFKPNLKYLEKTIVNGDIKEIKNNG